jgi:hypothetical protein
LHLAVVLGRQPVVPGNDINPQTVARDYRNRARSLASSLIRRMHVSAIKPQIRALGVHGSTALHLSSKINLAAVCFERFLQIFCSTADKSFVPASKNPVGRQKDRQV